MPTAEALPVPARAIFAHILLADEITGDAEDASALLEDAGGGGHGRRRLAPAARAVLRARHQNPIEMEGTTRCPRRSSDRFLFKLRVRYRRSRS